MKLKHFKNFFSFIFAIILTLGLSIAFQSLLAAWTAPLANPPACLSGNPGCDAPLNTSTSAQVTNGSLWMVNSSNPSYGLIVEQGKVGIGTNTTNLNQLVAQLQVTAPTGTEGLRIISASDYSPLNIRNNANDADIFRVDQTGTLQVGIVPWARLSGVPDNVGNAISALTAGTGITVSGSGSSRTITNSAPDQTVTLTGAGATTISGTYPIFTISSTDTDTNTTYSVLPNQGLRLNGTNFALINTCSNGQLLKYINPSWACADDNSGAGGTVTSVTAGSGLSGGTITTSGTISLDMANANTWTGTQTFSALQTSQANISGNVIKAQGGATEVAVNYRGSAKGFTVYDNTTSLFRVDSAGDVSVTQKLTVSGNIVVNGTVDGIDVSAKATNWDTAYNERRQWDGGATNLTAATGRTSLGLNALASASLSCSANQIAKWNGSSWACGDDNSGAGGTVTSVTAGSGLSGGTITTSGTISLDLANANTWNGTQTFSAVTINGAAALSLTQTTNANFYIDSNKGLQLRLDKDDLTDGSSDSSAFNINNGANSTIWSVDETGTLNTGIIPWAKLTSVPSGLSDGDNDTTYNILASQGLRLSGTSFGLINTCSNNQLLKYNSTSSSWACGDDSAGSGTVTSISAGTGLSGGTITTSGTISLNTTNPNTWSGTQTFNSGLQTNQASISGNIINTKTGVSEIAINYNSNAGKGFTVYDSLTSPLFRVDSAGDVSVTQKLTVSGNIVVNGTVDGIDVSAKATNWDTAYNERNRWDGGSTGLTAATGRTSLGLNALASATLACSANQIAKWNGSAWACANDNAGGGASYSAGTGLSLTGTTFSLNLANVNTWTATTTLSNANLVMTGTAAMKFNQTTLSYFFIDSNKGIQLRLDADNNDSSSFNINNGANTTIWSVDETGTLNTGIIPWARVTGAPSFLTSETDPQVNTLTNGKWCTTDGSVINCASDAPSGGSGSGMTNPMTKLGDIIYGGTDGAATKLAGAAGFLKSTGAAAPSFAALVADDIPNLGAAKITTGTFTNARIASAATWNAKAPTASPTFTGSVTMPGTGIWNSSGFVGIGTTTPSYKLEVVGGSIKATGGLIIETRTSDPASPATGQIWLRTDL